MRSIIENLGTESFPRLRVGIGKRPDLEDYVLRPFSRAEISRVSEVEEKVTQAVLCWLTKDMTHTMNIYNARKGN